MLSSVYTILGRSSLPLLLACVTSAPASDTRSHQHSVSIVANKGNSRPALPRPTSAANADRRILDAVTDGQPHIDQPALRLLLARAASADWDAATTQALTVTVAALLGAPQKYRGRLVSLPGRFIESRPIRLTHTPGPAIEAHVLLALDRQYQQPVNLVTLEPPIGFARLAALSLTGYFLQLRTDRRRQPDPLTGATTITVPVLVARRVLAEARPEAPGAPLAHLRRPLALIGAMLCLYVAIRLWSARIRKRRPAGRAGR